MNLEHIPTPETDLNFKDNIWSTSDYGARRRLVQRDIDLMKDLERRLTVAREALEAITRRGPIMGSKDEYREGQLDALNAVAMTARKALDLTNTRQ